MTDSSIFLYSQRALMEKMMNFSVSVLVLICLASILNAQNGFTPPSGYQSSGLGFSDPNISEIAVSPSGRLAIAYNSSSGGGHVDVFSSITNPRVLIQSFTNSLFKYFGGLTFSSDDSLYFTENGNQKTLYNGSVSAGNYQNLAPIGSLPNAAQIAIRPSDNLPFVLLQNNPGQGKVVIVNNGITSDYASNIGYGYLGGIAFQPGTENLFIGDNNNINNTGSGEIIKLNGNSPAAYYSSAGGNGYGLYSFCFNSSDVIIASTGSTLTRLNLTSGFSAQFGTWGSSSAFATSIASYQDTTLVNAEFTPSSDILLLKPVPEPTSMIILAAVILFYIKRGLK